MLARSGLVGKSLPGPTWSHLRPIFPWAEKCKNYMFVCQFSLVGQWLLFNQMRLHTIWVGWVRSKADMWKDPKQRWVVEKLEGHAKMPLSWPQKIDPVRLQLIFWVMTLFDFDSFCLGSGGVWKWSWARIWKSINVGSHKHPKYMNSENQNPCRPKCWQGLDE